MNFEFSCIASRIFLDLPLQLWEAQVADGLVEPLVTRFFHNKLLFLLNNFLRCYLSYFSPEFIVSGVFVLGLALYVFGFWGLVGKKRVLLWVLLSPLPALFETGPVIFRAFLVYAAMLLVVAFGLGFLSRSAYRWLLGSLK